MLHALISHVFHGLLYIMSALLLYLVLTPIYLYKEQKRKILFVLILIVLTYFYWGYEELDPLAYTLHLTPVSLSLAVLFVGSVPGVASWIAFNIGNSIVLHNDFWPTFIASTLLLSAGIFIKRRRIDSAFKLGIIYSTTLMTIYMVSYFLTAPQLLAQNLSIYLYTIVLSYVSTWFVTYLFFLVKKQEINKEKLLHLEKDRMIGQLAASISHEIRNPLTTTRGFLQMMEQKDFPLEDRKRFISLALSGIDQANAIITDYLNYAKPTPEQKKRLDVKEEVASMIRFITPMAVENEIRIDITHETDYPLYILGDPKKLRQCLMNLIKNAIESMPDGGDLTITTRRLDDIVQITITDTGVGMSKAQINSLGLPFHTTKEQGTGLGLVVVMSIIKAMNGKISFSSNVNQGTMCLLQFQSS